MAKKLDSKFSTLFSHLSQEQIKKMGDAILRKNAPEITEEVFDVIFFDAVKKHPGEWTATGIDSLIKIHDADLKAIFPLMPEDVALYVLLLGKAMREDVHENIVANANDEESDVDQKEPVSKQKEWEQGENRFD